MIMGFDLRGISPRGLSEVFFGERTNAFGTTYTTVVDFSFADILAAFF